MPNDRACPTPELTECFRKMLLIRYFEEALSDLFSRNMVGGTSHFCIGQEACAVGVVSAAQPDDVIVSNHRGHGHLLARGLDPMRVMAELLGRETGYCGGRGGSQHMCAMDMAFLGTNGITGGGIPIATGAAFALKYQERPQIVLAFFGDGASNQGTFHESLNMASLWKLPVLYICENNLYGMSISVANSVASGTVAARAPAYDMPASNCDGMDVLAVREHTARMIEHVRSGAGPALLELHTYRYCGHSKNDARLYRTREEEAEWHGRDCLDHTATYLRERGLSQADIDALKQSVHAHVDQIVDVASQQPYGDETHALGGVYA